MAGDLSANLYCEYVVACTIIGSECRSLKVRREHPCNNCKSNDIPIQLLSTNFHAADSASNTENKRSLKGNR